MADLYIYSGFVKEFPLKNRRFFANSILRRMDISPSVSLIGDYIICIRHLPLLQNLGLANWI